MIYKHVCLTCRCYNCLINNGYTYRLAHILVSNIPTNHGLQACVHCYKHRCLPI